MKISRIIGIIIALTLAFALAISITACRNDTTDDPTPTPEPEPTLNDITGVLFLGDEFVYDGTEKKIEITGTLPKGVSVSYTNNVATDAGTYQATATLSGEGYNTLTLNATLTVTEAEMDLSFTKGEFVYDGTEKRIEIVGTLPENATVEYEGNAHTNAGTYTASVTVSCKNYKTFTSSVPVIINKADIVGVSLNPLVVTYDGSEKKLEVSGNLPEGVTVEYIGNSATEVGNYPITAVISGDNYNTLELNAFIVIEALPEDKEITGVTLDPAEFTYDGSERSILVSGEIPEGVNVNYNGNGKINVGRYTVTAVLSGEGYKTLTLTAELTIKKATITDVTLNNGNFTYSEGVYYNLEITGNLPDGVTVTYTGNNVTYAGTYKVTAVIEGENYETLVLEATLYIKGSNGSGFLTPEHPFT